MQKHPPPKEPTPFTHRPSILGGSTPSRLTMANPYPPNAQADLARERNRLAADRSLLSFVRNGLTLISTGIGLDQVLSLLYPTQTTPLWVRGLSLVLVGLGVLSVLGAAQDYRGELDRLEQPEYYFTPRRSLGGIIGGIMLLAAGFALLQLFMQRL